LRSMPHGQKHEGEQPKMDAHHVVKLHGKHQLSGCIGYQRTNTLFGICHQVTNIYYNNKCEIASFCWQKVVRPGESWVISEKNPLS
jgi:hypothetical protein